MSKVNVQIPGGDIKQYDAETVGQLKLTLGLDKHQATVNGEPEGDEYELNDFEFVTFSEKIKGA